MLRKDLVVADRQVMIDYIARILHISGNHDGSSCDYCLELAIFVTSRIEELTVLNLKVQIDLERLKTRPFTN